jgi:uncharacterized phage-associated protein
MKINKKKSLRLALEIEAGGAVMLILIISLLLFISIMYPNFIYKLPDITSSNRRMRIVIYYFVKYFGATTYFITLCSKLVFTIILFFKSYYKIINIKRIEAKHLLDQTKSLNNENKLDFVVAFCIQFALEDEVSNAIVEIENLEKYPYENLQIDKLSDSKQLEYWMNRVDIVLNTLCNMDLKKHLYFPPNILADFVKTWDMLPAKSNLYNKIKKAEADIDNDNTIRIISLLHVMNYNTGQIKEIWDKYNPKPLSEKKIIKGIQPDVFKRLLFTSLKFEFIKFEEYYSSRQVLENEDYKSLNQLKLNRLKLIAKAIYAKKAFRFKEKEYQDYFKQFDWYNQLLKTYSEPQELSIQEQSRIKLIEELIKNKEKNNKS